MLGGWAASAVLLIHEFVAGEADDAKHAVNACTLEDFLTRLGKARWWQSATRMWSFVRGSLKPTT